MFGGRSPKWPQVQPDTSTSAMQSDLMNLRNLINHAVGDHSEILTLMSGHCHAKKLHILQQPRPHIDMGAAYSLRLSWGMRAGRSLGMRSHAVSSLDTATGRSA